MDTSTPKKGAKGGQPLDRSVPPPPCPTCGGERTWIKCHDATDQLETYCKACRDKSKQLWVESLAINHQTGDPSGIMCEKHGTQKLWVIGKTSAKTQCEECRLEKARSYAEKISRLGIQNGDRADDCPKCGSQRIWRIYQTQAQRICRGCAKKTKYAGYRRGALERGYKWSISEGDFDRATSASCCYCGSADSAAGWGMGLDRWDNSRGYLPDNIVPCCKDCNRAKLTRSPREFVEVCRAIAAQHGAILSPTLEPIVNPLGYRMDWNAGTADPEGGK